MHLCTGSGRPTTAQPVSAWSWDIISSSAGQEAWHGGGIFMRCASRTKLWLVGAPGNRHATMAVPIKNSRVPVLQVHISLDREQQAQSNEFIKEDTASHCARNTRRETQRTQRWTVCWTPFLDLTHSRPLLISTMTSFSLTSRQETAHWTLMTFWMTTLTSLPVTFKTTTAKKAAAKQMEILTLATCPSPPRPPPSRTAVPTARQTCLLRWATTAGRFWSGGGGWGPRWRCSSSGRRPMSGNGGGCSPSMTPLKGCAPTSRPFRTRKSSPRWTLCGSPSAISTSLPSLSSPIYPLETLAARRTRSPRR